MLEFDTKPSAYKNYIRNFEVFLQTFGYNNSIKFLKHYHIQTFGALEHNENHFYKQNDYIGPSISHRNLWHSGKLVRKHQCSITTCIFILRVSQCEHPLTARVVFSLL